MNYAAANALSLAESINDESRAWRACRIGLDGGLLHNPSGISDPWLGWLERAEQYAHTSTAARVRFSRAKSVSLLESGHHLESWQLREDALQLARSTEDADTEFGIAWLLLRYVIPAHRDQQLLLLDEFSQRPPTGVSVLNLCALLLQTGTFYLSLGDRIKAEDQWRELSELVERTRQPRFAAWALVREAILATLDGRLDDVMQLSRSILEQTEAEGSTSGRRDAAEASRRAALWLGQVDQIGPDGDHSLAWRSLALAHLGRTGEAQEAILDAMERVAQVPKQHLRLAELVVYLECATLAPVASIAEDVAQALVPMSGWVEPQSGACVGRLLGDASVLLGKPVEARDYYAQALEVCEKVRFRPELALSHLGLAELLLEHYPDEHEAATEHLDFAISEFREMKMQPSLERALRHRGLLKA